MNRDALTGLVKTTAARLGFSFCGIAKAEFLDHEAPRLEEWLARSYQGTMRYLENHFDKRLDPRLLVPGARSIVSLGYNYAPQQPITESGFKIARYAYGEDYHRVVKDKLFELMSILQEQAGAIQGRAFVDSAPVLERPWAQRAGNGWVGKNSLLLNKQMGSYFFLAELVIDLDLNYDSPVKDYCGTCTACMDACPTDAIPEPYVVDGSKCISYYTIELKDAIPASEAGKFENWIFGCDICQEVCPWNRFSKPHHEKKFEPSEELKALSKSDWRDITQEVFNRVFEKSAVQRTRWEGFVRNLEFVRGTKQNETE